jgi:predicted DNA-binding protein YlxM (UPF0122 family)
MTDPAHWNIFITLGGTFLAGVFGVGVGYQVVKSAISDHEKRLVKIELKLDNQVGLVQCDRNRLSCSSTLEKELANLAEQIETNRNVVTDFFQRIENFMGRVTQFMEKNGQRHL